MISIYSARWVLPISSAAIDDGAVVVDNSKIVAVGPRSEIISRFPESRVLDFGPAAILPGFINAHSHLELTVMRGFLESEEHDFFAWLRKLTIARLAMTPHDLFISAMAGAVEAASSGITCLGDSSSAATNSMNALREMGLRGIVYQESFGPDPATATENVAKLRDQLDELRRIQSELVRAGVSPHAPYSVSGRQLEMISRMAVDDKLPLMIHAAESQAEKLLLSEGRGPFAEGLKHRGIDWQAPGVSSIQYLAAHGVLETRPLLAHCITVDGADIDLIKEHEAGIAHCPRSNAKLGHGRAPFAEFVANGLRVGLGSDSVASNNSCDILGEARFATLLARLDRGSSPGASNASELSYEGEPLGALRDGRATAPVTAKQALFAATLGGAKAMGLDDQIGSLKEGMQADIVVVGLDGPHQRPARNPADALMFSSSGRDVLLTVAAGKEIYRDGQTTTVDEAEIRKLLEAIRVRLDCL